jgi:hypothetical protein
MADNELAFILYRVICRANGKSYIGQTSIRAGWRWAKHVYAAMRKDRGCPALHAAIRAHGRDAFDVEELARAPTREAINCIERKMIAHFNTLAPNGYNLAPGGNVEPRSAATRAKIGASLTGRPCPWARGPHPERGPAISAAKKGKQPRGVGWHHSPETIERMRQAQARRYAHV